MRTLAGQLRALPSRTRAILLILLAVFFFSILETTAKYLSQFYPVIEVVWLRYTVHLAVMFFLLAPRMGKRLIATENLGGQLLRAALLMGSTLCNVGALSKLPLAEVKAISFVSPLLVTIFAVSLLRERVSWDRWVAVLVGFGGTLFIVRPGSAMVSWPAFLALGTATFYSLYQIMTRRISVTEAPVATLFYSAMVGCACLAVVVPFYWVTPSLIHIPLFILLGSMGAAGHYALIKAIELELASTLSAFGYAQLLWVILWGWLIFGQLPDAHAYIGMAIISASGLYVALGHKFLRREEPETAID
jgi:drug/metabolite transporter (DMT)-like permease